MNTVWFHGACYNQCCAFLAHEKLIVNRINLKAVNSLFKKAHMIWNDLIQPSLFINIQRPGITLAITGPWKRLVV